MLDHLEAGSTAGHLSISKGQKEGTWGSGMASQVASGTSSSRKHSRAAVSGSPVPCAGAAALTTCKNSPQGKETARYLRSKCALQGHNMHVQAVCVHVFVFQHCIISFCDSSEHPMPKAGDA